MTTVFRLVLLIRRRIFRKVHLQLSHNGIFRRGLRRVGRRTDAGRQPRALIGWWVVFHGCSMKSHVAEVFRTIVLQPVGLIAQAAPQLHHGFLARLGKCTKRHVLRLREQFFGFGHCSSFLFIQC